MSKKRYYGRRPEKANQRRHSTKQKRQNHTTPKIDPGLKKVFSQIGSPESGIFVPDAFQLEAIEKINDFDVLVSAPTGAGKTWIATQIIQSLMRSEKRVWYASPLKALSNSIYLQFSQEFGAETCGILTGDRKENPDAPVIVGTTEILRNQLYDAMHHGTSLHVDLVILDEAHYLSDPDRGVVWEETIIYLPPRVKLLLLSATISNAEEICAWMEDIRKNPCKVVRTQARPVPLEMLFLFPDGLIVPLDEKKGLHPKVKRFLVATEDKKRRGRPERIDFGNMIHCLKSFNLLPAIFFLKSRAECDRALETCRPVKSRHDKNKMAEELKSYFNIYPHLAGHRQIPYLEKRRVASHHGGQLPYWKVLVENMMSKGYLDAIFSTSTVAAGVNFPARTVVILQSDRFNGREFVDLTATELHQMVGRAGRRGKDNIGFGVVVHGDYQDPKLIHRLMNAQPEPVLSQIHINFSMTLNLLLSHSPMEVKALMERSFVAFQEDAPDAALKNRWHHMLQTLQSTLSKGRCDTTEPFEVMALIDKRRELKKEIRKKKRARKYEKTSEAFKNRLTPGRLFLHKNGNIYVVFQVCEEFGRLFCLAHNIRKSAQSKKNRFRLRRIDINQIQALLDYEVAIPADMKPEMLDRLFRDISLEDVIRLDMSRMSEESEPSPDVEEEIEPIKQALLSMPCETCVHLTTCHGGEKSGLQRQLREFRQLAGIMAGSGDMLWLNFKRHLHFLKETGFADAQERLTAEGLWASKLRVDQPLLIAELIHKNTLAGIPPEAMAGAIAPFVWDRSQVDIVIKSAFKFEELHKLFQKILEETEVLRTLKKRRGFEESVIQFWPCAALYLWAKGTPWDQLLSYLAVDEGDMASLVMRTADHLRQIVSLRETHPELAAVAETAIGLILREPVHIE